MNEKNSEQYWYIAFITVASVALVLVSQAKHDDPYIFYKYALNLTQGNGWVFNEGEAVNAATSILYPAVIAIIHHIINNLFSIHVNVEIIGLFVTVISFVLLVSITAKIIALNSAVKHFSFAESLFFALLVILISPILLSSVGMETFLSLFLCGSAIYAYLTKRFIILGVVLGLAFLSRMDTILLGMVLFLYHLITHRAVEWKSIVAFFLVILPWLVFSYFEFGSIFPATLGAKMAQGGDALGFIKQTFNSLFFKDTNYVIYSVVALLSLAALISSVKLRGGVNIIIISWLSLYIFTYAVILKAPVYYWYIFPVWWGIGIYLLIGIFRFKQFALNKMYELVVLDDNKITVFFNKSWFLLSVIIICFVLLQQIKGLNPFYYNDYHRYKAVSEYLNGIAHKTDFVATAEIGVLGYFYNGKVLDLLGLITPQAVEYRKQGKLNEFFFEQNPRFFITYYPYRKWLETFVEEVRFQDMYCLNNVIAGVAVYETKTTSKQCLVVKTE